MPAAADEQAGADQAVEDDHHRGEYGIAGEARRGLAAGQHHRHDQRDLDHRDRECEHEGAERLADTVCDHLGVMHRRDHAADESEHEQDKDARQPRHGPGQREQGDAERRHRQCPQRIVSNLLAHACRSFIRPSHRAAKFVCPGGSYAITRAVSFPPATKVFTRRPDRRLRWRASATQRTISAMPKREVQWSSAISVAARSAGSAS